MDAIKNGDVQWAVDQQPFLQGYLAVDSLWLYLNNGTGTFSDATASRMPVDSDRTLSNIPVYVAGFDRGVRPIGDWSMLITLSPCRVKVPIPASAVIRQPWPGTQMARGVKGRQRIVAYFSQQIPLRRENSGDDLFSQLCHATHEDGALLSTQDIVDHMSFLIMAAHDTLTSSLTSFVSMLAAHPEW